jgi:hypothetical protein
MATNREIKDSKLVEVLQREVATRLSKEVGDSFLFCLGIPMMQEKDLELFSQMGPQNILRAVHLKTCREVRRRYDFVRDNYDIITEHKLEYQEFALAYAFKHGDFSDQELGNIQFEAGDTIDTFMTKYTLPDYLYRAACSLITPRSLGGNGPDWCSDGPCTV